MGDLRVGSIVHSVGISPTGFEKGKKETKEFGKIFQDLKIDASTQNTKLCEEQGVVVEKKLDERDLEDLTKKPPFGGRTILGPYS